MNSNVCDVQYLNIFVESFYANYCQLQHSRRFRSIVRKLPYHKTGIPVKHHATASQTPYNPVYSTHSVRIGKDDHSSDQAPKILYKEDTYVTGRDGI